MQISNSPQYEYEAVEVFVQVEGSSGQRLWGDRGVMPAGGEAVECAGHTNDGVLDEQVGDEVIVFDYLGHNHLAMPPRRELLATLNR